MNTSAPVATAIDHVNIVVSDLDASEAFYTKVLGFEKTRQARLEGAWIETIVGLEGVEADVVYVQPPGGGPRIELLCYQNPKGAALSENAMPNTVGLRHIALRVPDIGEVCGRLREAGIDPIGPPTQVPEGVVKHDAGRKRLCYLRDPDGVLLELAEYT